MPMKDWSTFVQPLELPINGKTYVVPAVSLEDGLKIAEVENASGPVEGVTDGDVWRMFLGSAYDEMQADRVPFQAFKRAAFTAMFDHKLGRAAAERFWEAGSAPKVLEDLTTAATLLEEATANLTEKVSSADSPPSPSTE